MLDRLIRISRNREMIAVDLWQHLRKQPFPRVDHQSGAVHMRATAACSRGQRAQLFQQPVSKSCADFGLAIEQ
jgi:hypothetical protein